jgi:hypothetical protein
MLYGYPRQAPSLEQKLDHSSSPWRRGDLGFYVFGESGDRLGDWVFTNRARCGFGTAY